MIARCNSTSAFLLPDPRPPPTKLRRFLLTPPLPSTHLSPSAPLPRIHRSAGRDPVRKEAKQRDRDEGGGGGGGGGDRHMHCEVDVVSWRERRILARVVVSADVRAVWSVLTDYDRLADFIPNLVYSGTVPCPHEGRIWLEQRGLQRALYWHIEARVVLDLQEFPDSVNGHELHFSLVDGDFKKFEGKWSVKAIPRSSNTTLSYEVNVIPRFNFPAMFIERIISSDLPVNLQALAFRAETLSKGNQKSCPSGYSTFTNVEASSLSSSMTPVGTLTELNKVPVDDLTENSALPAPPPPPPPTNLNSTWGVFGKFCSLDRPCMVDEVHLRRFDALLVTHCFHSGKWRRSSLCRC